MTKKTHPIDIDALIAEGKGLSGCEMRGMDMSRKDLAGAQVFDADLEGAALVGANLSNCDLTHSNLKGADLTKANLSNARLWNANLTGANLSEADLSGADLWNACLYNTKMWHAQLNGAKSLTMRNFSKGAKMVSEARLNESGLLAAEESYRALKTYFLHNGMYNDASWASFKEKTMERLILKKNRSWHYIPSVIMNILCGYGEKPYRIVQSALFTVLFFAIINFLLNGVVNPSDPSYMLRWSDYLYYSTVTFTTVGYGDFVPKATSFFRLLAASEAFLGVFLTGLFIFTLARKYTAR